MWQKKYDKKSSISHNGNKTPSMLADPPYGIIIKTYVSW